MQNEIVFICGRKGCGKTTLAAKIARTVYWRRDRVLVVAPMAGFSLPGAPVLSVADPDRLSRLSGRSCVFNVQSDPVAASVFRFAWAVQDDPVSSLWLVVDEIDLFFSWRDPDPSLSKIVRYGRHRRINLVGVSQRPANVHNDLLAQADRRVIFQTTEPNDLAYLRKYAGIDPDQVKSLPRFRFLTV